MGAGAEKVGSIAGTNAKNGQQLIDSFLKKFPALKLLKDGVSLKVKNPGYLKGLDGRQLICRSKHAALSSLLQGFEANVCKLATWLTFNSLKNEHGFEHGKDFGLCGFFHDEIQISCREDISTIVGETFVKSIQDAGVKLGSKCPLTGAYKVGSNWRDTH